jgi:hypothetical protein
MWWVYIVVPALMIIGIYCFLSLVGVRTRLTTRETDRTADSMYSNYAELNRKQRKYARERDGQRQDDEGSKTP